MVEKDTLIHARIVGLPAISWAVSPPWHQYYLKFVIDFVLIITEKLLVIMLYVCRNSRVSSHQVHPSPAYCRDACGANAQKRDLRRTLYCPLWTHRTAAASATPPVAGLSWVWSKSTRRKRKRRRRAASRNSHLSG